MKACWSPFSNPGLGEPKDSLMLEVATLKKERFATKSWASAGTSERRHELVTALLGLFARLRVWSLGPPSRAPSAMTHAVRGVKHVFAAKSTEEEGAKEPLLKDMPIVQRVIG